LGSHRWRKLIGSTFILIAASSIACSSAKAIGGPPGPRNGAPGGKLLTTSKSASSFASAG
jgi:hypothetical protein